MLFWGTAKLDKSRRPTQRQRGPAKSNPNQHAPTHHADRLTRRQRKLLKPPTGSAAPVIPSLPTAAAASSPTPNGAVTPAPPLAGDHRPPATPGMPPSRFVHLILLVTLSLLLAQTLASSSPAPAASAASASAGAGAEAETGDPCAAAAADGDGDVQLCPVRCFRPDPVCGADGVTYWCGCPEAACAGARVARRGYCEVGAGSAPVSGQALLLVHIVWLFVLGAAVLLGFL
ncbi:uncharacterized protein LOC112894467 [Panicum hallii]|nr:uncharacterized protein LOC112894467 [Panicum hallii]